MPLCSSTPTSPLLHQPRPSLVSAADHTLVSWPTETNGNATAPHPHVVLSKTIYITCVEEPEKKTFMLQKGRTMFAEEITDCGNSSRTVQDHVLFEFCSELGRQGMLASPGLALPKTSQTSRTC